MTEEDHGARYRAKLRERGISPGSLSVNGEARSSTVDIEAARAERASAESGGERRPWPSPEVSCRLARPTEVPLGARRVQGAAEAAGWVVVVTYARGTTVAGKDKHRALVDSIALRMRSIFKPDLRAVATWERIDEDDTNGIKRKWKHDLAYVWEAGKLAPRRIGLERLRDILTGDSHLEIEETEIGT